MDPKMNKKRPSTGAYSSSYCPYYEHLPSSAFSVFEMCCVVEGEVAKGVWNTYKHCLPNNGCLPILSLRRHSGSHFGTCLPWWPWTLGLGCSSVSSLQLPSWYIKGRVPICENKINKNTHACMFKYWQQSKTHTWNPREASSLWRWDWLKSTNGLTQLAFSVQLSSALCSFWWLSWSIAINQLNLPHVPAFFHLQIDGRK